MLNHLRFADAAFVINARDLWEVEAMIQDLNTASTESGLKMNMKKTKWGQDPQPQCNKWNSNDRYT